MINRHHSHVKCEDCGERHTPGNPTECIEVLRGIVADHRVVLAERDDLLRLARIDIESFKERNNTLNEMIEGDVEQIAALTKNRGEWQQVAETARLHSTGGINGKRWDACECPSCFLHMAYKAEIAALKEKAEDDKNLSNFLDKKVSDRIAVLTTTNAILVEEIERLQTAAERAGNFADYKEANGEN